MVLPSGAKRGRELEPFGGEISTHSFASPNEPSGCTATTQITVLWARRRMNVSHLPSHDKLGNSSSPLGSRRSFATMPFEGSIAHRPSVVGEHSPRIRLPSGNQSLARLKAFIDC